MKTSPLVTIITPVFNGGELLRSTVNSVVSQAYSSIEYIVVDGGSTDQTFEVVSAARDAISVFISEKDSGMYDALAKGLAMAKGEIICYVNAGDCLYPHAVQVAVDLFENDDVSWLTGYRSVSNDAGQITHVDLPFRYTRTLIGSGSYGRSLPFIQQESTFWRRSLLDLVDIEFFRGLKYAGDYYLWWCFSKKFELSVVSSPLGIFRKHEGQLSERMDKYRLEVDSFSGGRGVLVKLKEVYELFLWALHPKVRSFFHKTVYRFDHKNQVWSRASR